MRKTVAAAFLVLLCSWSYAVGQQSGQDTQPPRASTENKEQSSATPDAAGLYYMTEHGLQPLVGRAVVFRRTGGLLKGALTFGIGSAKINIHIPGSHGEPVLRPRPVFYYRAGPDDRPGALSLVLARLRSHRNRRELEARAGGLGRQSQGISINSQIQTNITGVSPGVYRIEPAGDLEAGEYAFYLRTTGASTQDAFLYDFSVE